jgi:hypothetical protein
MLPFTVVVEVHLAAPAIWSAVVAAGMPLLTAEWHSAGLSNDQPKVIMPANEGLPRIQDRG